MWYSILKYEEQSEMAVEKQSWLFDSQNKGHPLDKRTFLLVQSKSKKNKLLFHQTLYCSTPTHPDQVPRRRKAFVIGNIFRVKTGFTG